MLARVMPPSALTLSGGETRSRAGLTSASPAPPSQQFTSAQSSSSSCPSCLLHLCLWEVGSLGKVADPSRDAGAVIEALITTTAAGHQSGSPLCPPLLSPQRSRSNPHHSRKSQILLKVKSVTTRLFPGLLLHPRQNSCTCVLGTLLQNEGLLRNGTWVSQRTPGAGRRQPPSKGEAGLGNSGAGGKAQYPQ